MIDEKDVIALMAGTIENAETDKNGNVGIDKDTFDHAMNTINEKFASLNERLYCLEYADFSDNSTSATDLIEKLSSLDKRIYNLEYAHHNDKSTAVIDVMELRKELNSLKCKVDQIEAALNMSEKYRKRRDKVSKD